MWTDWIKFRTAPESPKLPPLPDYPEIGEAFRPEYEKMAAFFYDNLRPLLFEGYTSSDAVAASARRWDEIARAITARLATYDFRADRPRSEKAVNLLIQAAKHVAVVQIKQEYAAMEPGTSLADEQINQAIDSLNGLFKTKIWPEEAPAQSAVRS